MAQAPVRLNIYNMHWLNEYISNLGIGIYHSGVEVYDKEYAFGGHPFDFTGIFDMAPSDVEELGEGFTFKESILLGHTDFSEKEIKKLIEMMGRSFSGSSYHLIKKNCNHFSSDFCKLVCGKNIPNWVNRLAAIGIRFPFLIQCIPKDWLTPDPGGSYSDYIDMTEWVEIESIPDNSSSTSEAVISFNDILPECESSLSNVTEKKGIPGSVDTINSHHQQSQECKHTISPDDGGYSLGMSEPIALLDALSLFKPIDSLSEISIGCETLSFKNEPEIECRESFPSILQAKVFVECTDGEIFAETKDVKSSDQVNTHPMK